MEKEQVKAWVTKYALTEGIVAVDGEVCHNISSGMLTYGNYGTAHGKDWHRTPEAAIAKAEEMRKAKIASLKKSIAKMESLKFETSNAALTSGEAVPVESTVMQQTED